MYFPTRYLLRKARVYMHSSYVYAQETGRDIQRVIQNLFLIKILKTSENEFFEYEKQYQVFRMLNSKI